MRSSMLSCLSPHAMPAAASCMTTVQVTQMLLLMLCMLSQSARRVKHLAVAVHIGSDIHTQNKLYICHAQVCARQHVSQLQQLHLCNGAHVSCHGMGGTLLCPHGWGSPGSSRSACFCWLPHKCLPYVPSATCKLDACIVYVVLCYQRKACIRVLSLTRMLLSLQCSICNNPGSTSMLAPNEIHAYLSL